MNHPSRREFRPNPARSVAICGLFGKEHVNTALAEVKAFLRRSSEPITIYIGSSAGGLLKALRQLEDIMGMNNPKGRKHHFITVLQHSAHSVAAYLAILGTNSYMEPQSKLVFHGIACADYKKGMILRREDATALAIRLDRENRIMARKLATAILPRLLLRYQLLKRTSCSVPDTSSGAMAPAANWLTDQISSRLVSDKCRYLLRSAQTYSDSLAFFVKQDNPKRRKEDHHQFRNLGCYLSRCLGECVENDWPIDELTLAEIGSNYFFFNEIAGHDLTAFVRNLGQQFGEGMLNKVEYKKYISLKKRSIKMSAAFMMRKSAPILTNLWYFSLGLCSKLLIGEITISAPDAYWLCLIDEIIEPTSMSDQVELVTDKALIHAPRVQHE